MKDITLRAHQSGAEAGSLDGLIAYKAQHICHFGVHPSAMAGCHFVPQGKFVGVIPAVSRGEDGLYPYFGGVPVQKIPAVPVQDHKI